MSIARELITLLRYELDDSGLKKFANSTQAADKGSRRTAEGVRQLGTDATRSATLMGNLGGMLRGALAGIGVVSLARMSDEWAGVEGRVGLVTDGVQEQKQALDGLYTAAQATGQQYTALAGVFQGVARNKKELGLTTDQALKLSETIGTAMTIGGGSAASQQAALMQLSQAMGTGTLRGEELNSIMEQAPRLAQAIAKAFNVPVGRLKELGEQGKLSSKILAEGLLAQSQELRAEFERMPKTFSRAATMVGNKLGDVIYRINKATKASEGFFKVVGKIVDNFDDLLKSAAALAGAVLFTKLTAGARALGGAAAVLRTALAKLPLKALGRIFAIATALYYVFDDIGVWFQGGDSLLGSIIGPMEDWQWAIDGVATGLALVRDTIAGALGGLPGWAQGFGVVAVIIAGIVLAIGAIPTLLVGAGLAVAAAVNLIRQNWSQAVGEMGAAWDGLVGAITGAWDSIRNKALEVWQAIGAAISNAIPEWARKGISVAVGAVAGATSSAQGRAGVGAVAGATGSAPGAVPALSGGGSPFGVTPAAMPRAPATTSSVVANTNVTTNVNATSSQPAAVAEAARRGTQRGMGAMMVPNVEASR